MRHLEQEIISLRKDVVEMWKLVIGQVTNAGEAILTFDKDLAAQVAMREKKVDAYELKIDSECENIIALHQPVAVDLRFVLAVLKINSNLERVADFAYGVSRILTQHPTLILDADLIMNSNLRVMVAEVNKMLVQALDAFEEERSELAASIFGQDSMVDDINQMAPRIFADYIKLNPDRTLECLELLSAFRKLERIGDHCSNIAEEIFFYLDAKVLKHSDIN